jgi:hypothetical protein
VKRAGARCKHAKQASREEGKRKTSLRCGRKKECEKIIIITSSILNYITSKQPKRKRFQETFQMSLNFKHFERTLNNVRGGKKEASFLLMLRAKLSTV